MATMRRRNRSLQNTQTLHLLAYVAVADALLILVGIPFELGCLHAVTDGNQSMQYLLAVCVANASIVAYMGTAAAVTGELLRRGVTLSGAVLERLRAASRR